MKDRRNREARGRRCSPEFEENGGGNGGRRRRISSSLVALELGFFRGNGEGLVVFIWGPEGRDIRV